MKKIILAAAVTVLSVLCASGVLASEIRAFDIPEDINLIVTNVHGGTNNNSPGDSLNISWTNPDYEISEITLTEETLGNISGIINTNSGEGNSIRVTGLTTNKIYTFTVSITDDEDTVHSYTTTGRPAIFYKNRRTEEAGKNIWEFKIEGLPAASGYFVDLFDKKEGASSLKIVKNSNTESDVAHFKVEQNNEIKLEEGKEYNFSFWLKSELSGAGSRPIYLQQDVNSNIYYLKVSAEWKYYEFKIYDIAKIGEKYQFTLKDVNTGTEINFVNLDSTKFTPRLRFRGLGSAWIDDMKLCKYKTDGTLDGNLYINSNFDWCGSFQSSVTSEGDKAEISIKTSGDDIVKTTEISVFDEKGMLVAQETAEDGFSADTKKIVVLDNIEQGTVYSYWLKMVINGITHYYPIEFIGSGISDGTEYEVLPLHIEKNGNPLSSLASGDITVSRIFDNTEGTEDRDVLFAVALYYDDELIQIAEDVQTVYAGSYSNLSVDMTVPTLNDDKYELRIFLWDSADGQNIIKGMSKIKSN
jgi:hypothetical protein